MVGPIPQSLSDILHNTARDTLNSRGDAIAPRTRDDIASRAQDRASYHSRLKQTLAEKQPLVARKEEPRQDSARSLNHDSTRETNSISRRDSSREDVRQRPEVADERALPDENSSRERNSVERPAGDQKFETPADKPSTNDSDSDRPAVDKTSVPQETTVAGEVDDADGQAASVPVEGQNAPPVDKSIRQKLPAELVQELLGRDASANPTSSATNLQDTGAQSGDGTSTSFPVVPRAVAVSLAQANGSSATNPAATPAAAESTSLDAGVLIESPETTFPTGPAAADTVVETSASSPTVSNSSIATTTIVSGVASAAGGEPAGNRVKSNSDIVTTQSASAPAAKLSPTSTTKGNPGDTSRASAASGELTASATAHRPSSVVSASPGMTSGQIDVTPLAESVGIADSSGTVADATTPSAGRNAGEGQPLNGDAANSRPQVSASGKLANQPPTTAESVQLAQGTVSRIQDAIETMTSRSQPLRVRLDPPDLGVLQIEISQRDGVTTARLQVESSTTHRAILETLPQLRETLQQQHQVTRVEVMQSEPTPSHGQFAGDRQHSQQGSRDDRQDNESYQPDRPEVTESNDKTNASPRNSRRRNVSGLDIQV